MRTWHVVTLVLVALVLGTSFAHVLQWPAKLHYDGPLYSRTGFVEPAALLAVLVLAALLRHDRRRSPWSNVRSPCRLRSEP
jgi:hypothetical protein